MNITLSPEAIRGQQLAANLLATSMKVVEAEMRGLAVYKSIKTYGRSLRAATRGLWKGALDRFAFMDSVLAAMQREFEQAWREGARVCGVEPDERTQEEQEALDKFVSSQAQYLPGLADWIMAHSKFWLDQIPTLEPIEPLDEPPIGGTAEEQMLTDDIVYDATADRSLGGVNESYRVNVGDQEAIIKPGANIWEKEMEAEVFADKLSKDLGYDIVPTTVKRDAGTYTLPDGSIANVDASMQQWVNDGVLGTDVNWKKVDERSYSQMVLQDSLSNNRDRHLGNWMTVDGKVVAIDNGLSFRGMQENIFHHSSFVDGFEGYLEGTGKELMKFNESDIDAITDLVKDKDFKSSFTDTFGNDKWTSLEYQANVITKNKSALIEGIDIDFWMEDL